jgi:hypothetical protein
MLLVPEDGEDTFFTNIGYHSLDYIALYPRRQNSAYPDPTFGSLSRFHSKEIFIGFSYKYGSRNSAGGIATAYGLDDRGVGV